MAVTKEHLEEIHRLVKELREAHEESLKKIDPLIDAKLEKLNQRIDELEEKVASIPVKGKVLPFPTGAEGKDDSKAKEYKAAFWGYVRKGLNSLAPEQVKALSESVDSEGGYTVPEDFRAELIRALAEQSVVRGLCRTVNTSRDVVVVPSLASGVSWEWVDETTGPAGSQPSFGQLRVPVHTAMGKTQASNNLLEDSALNIEQLLATLFAESLAEEEDRVILAGTGNGEPEGILTNAEVEVIDTETAGQVKPDDFIELTYSLKDKYARNAVLLVARTAKKILRKAKDSNGQYLWQPALSAGEPPTFDGYRVISPSVGLAEQITAGAKIAVFGDLRYYWVIERVGMTLQRLAELYAEQNQVGFVLRRRMGGKLMLPEAVKVLRVRSA